MEDRYFYRKIVDEIPLPVYVFQDGDFKFFNQAFIDLSGYEREEMAALDFIDLVHPGYRENLVCQTRLALSGHGRDLPKEFELEVILKNGETRWIRVKPRIIEHNSQPAILGIVSSIAECHTR